MNARAADFASGKGHRDENFPVASWLLAPAHRAPIMAFYRFARAADDIGDHPTASAEDRLAGLAAMRAGLGGTGATEAEALREVMAAHGIDPVHAHELLDAFEQDVRVSRYDNWQGLMAYCRLSAAPVGRFVLDVHGEDRACWPASDALCAALQVINHLQDCGKDYRAIDRVYLPLDLVAANNARIEDLGAAAATPELRATIAALAARTQGLLAASAPFASMIRSRRLGMEVAVIQRLAESLVERLLVHDPLRERVHHRKAEAGLLALGAAARRWLAGGPNECRNVPGDRARARPR
ncbi:squalene synthase HpnC [Starkeya sp. ORNL1]|uniref:squalene synthase HpnC n=1 Tax=Starkeya sp. ORNL1 TaxID=2709380 RepID=UPI00146411C2|nr:squalene synthase HpnC [Starkeya sp. ORNL1]QJP14928.1 squalene synthase HpnC [Starkeya sp. ORNL1]